MNEPNPLKNEVEQRRLEDTIPPVVDGVTRGDERKMRRDMLRLNASSAKEAKIAAKEAAKEAKIAAKRADKEAKIAAKKADKEAKIAAKKADKEAEIAAKVLKTAKELRPETVAVTDAGPTPDGRADLVEKSGFEVDCMYDFSNEPVPRSKKELVALVLKLNDVNVELRKRLRENALADPAQAAATIMAEAARSADRTISEAQKRRDSLIEETGRMLQTSLEEVREEMTAALERAAGAAIDAVKNMKIR